MKSWLIPHKSSIDNQSAKYSGFPCFPPGMRARHPKSLVTGLMWVDFTRRDWFTAIRHEALHADGTAACVYYVVLLKQWP